MQALVMRVYAQKHQQLIRRSRSVPPKSLVLEELSRDSNIEVSDQDTLKQNSRRDGETEIDKICPEPVLPELDFIENALCQLAERHIQLESCDYHEAEERTRIRGAFQKYHEIIESVIPCDRIHRWDRDTTREVLEDFSMRLMDVVKEKAGSENRA